MACIKLPVPSLPTLPSPLVLPSISVGGFDLGVGNDFCCTFHYKLGIPPLTLGLPPVVLIPLIAALSAAQATMASYLDQLQVPKCPFD